jgi:hypothetical protein
MFMNHGYEVFDATSIEYIPFPLVAKYAYDFIIQ